MQGSLDHPPIIIRSSRWKTGAHFLLFFAMTVAVFLWQRSLPGDPFSKEWFLAEAGLLVFGFAAFLAALRF